MKKIIFLLLAAPLISSAATFTLSTETGEVRAGERVSVSIGVDAGEERIVTVKAALSYPETLLELVSFSFAPEAFALSQPGYDTEGEGVLVKTAGFPGGFVGLRPFGVAEFAFRAEGVPAEGTSAPISVSTDSLLLNAQGVNRLTETATLALAVAHEAPVSVPELSPLPQSAGLTPAVGAPAVPSFESVSSVPETADQAAAVGASALWKNPLVITLLSLFAVGILAALAWYTIR